MPYQPDLQRLLTPGSTYVDEHTEYVIEPHALDAVVTPTGRIVGCDPLVCADDQPPYADGLPTS